MTARVAFLVANEGVECAELVGPWNAVMRAGAEPVLIVPKTGDMQPFQHLHKAETRTATATTAEARPDEFEALVRPGGVAKADELGTDAAASSSPDCPVRPS
jgi:protease I